MKKSLEYPSYLHIIHSHLSAVAAAQLHLYCWVYLMGWGSAVVGLGKAIVVGIFWILQKFGWNLWQSLQDRSALRELCAPEELEAVNHASSVLASSCYLHGGSSVLGHFPFSVVPASFHVPEEQGCVPCRGWSPANKKKVSPFPRTVSTLLKTEVSQESWLWWF